MKFLLSLFFLFSLAAAQADVITLAWDANPEPDLDHYELLVGTASGTYTQTIQITSATQSTLTLPDGVLHYAVVRAVNTSGQASEPSRELCFQSGPNPTAPAAPRGLHKITN